jgi:hypothetical protein
MQTRLEGGLATGRLFIFARRRPDPAERHFSPGRGDFPCGCMDEGSDEIVSREMAFEEGLVAMRLADGRGRFRSGRFRNEQYSCAASFMAALRLARVDKDDRFAPPAARNPGCRCAGAYSCQTPLHLAMHQRSLCRLTRSCGRLWPHA